MAVSFVFMKSAKFHAQQILQNKTAKINTPTHRPKMQHADLHFIIIKNILCNRPPCI